MLLLLRFRLKLKFTLKQLQSCCCAEGAGLERRTTPSELDDNNGSGIESPGKMEQASTVRYQDNILLEGAPGAML